MKNGKYILVEAPRNYPGKVYRDGKYCYEHHLVWWQHYGCLPKKGNCLHHKDGNFHNNIINNLEEINWREHNRQHTLARGRAFVKLKCPMCEKIFIRAKNRTHLCMNDGRATFCSKSCGYKFNKIKNKKRRLKENIIEEFRGINEGSEYKPEFGGIL
jgi:hypothetical protein